MLSTTRCRVFNNVVKRGISKIIPTSSSYSDSIRIEPVQTTALSVYKNSCYSKLDFRIREDQQIKHAVSRFVAFNVGSLAVVDNKDKLVGVITQSDVLANTKNSIDLTVKDICTVSPNLIVAKTTDSLDTCMNKMIFKDIRHLLVVDEKDENFIGMISMKDIIKNILKDKKEIIMRLSDFKIGKGAFFGSE